eukprot:scaffold22265_cov92-Amphora_coffeaeformis.AAC.1
MRLTALGRIVVNLVSLAIVDITILAIGILDHVFSVFLGSLRTFLLFGLDVGFRRRFAECECR